MQVSDRYGRKACMFAAIVVSTTFTAAGTACTNYWAWLAMRLLAGMGSAGTGLAAFVLATEAIGARWRGAHLGAVCLQPVDGQTCRDVLRSLLPLCWREQ